MRRLTHPFTSSQKGAVVSAWLTRFIRTYLVDVDPVPGLSRLDRLDMIKEEA